MNRAIKSLHLRNFSLFVTILGLLNSCNDFNQFDCFRQEDGCTPNPTAGSPEFTPMAGNYVSMAGTDVAGTDSAGTNMAGVEIAGTMLGSTEIAGTNMAGTNMAGTNMAGTNMAGTNMAGTNMAGTNMAGTNMAGTNMGGTEIAGTNMAGTEMGGIEMGGINMAGEDMAGRPNNDCDPDIFDRLCLECSDDGTVVQVDHDDRCPDVECPPQYVANYEDGICFTLTTMLPQTCIHNQRSRCAGEEHCPVFDDPNEVEEENREDEYSAPADGCYQLRSCTGDPDHDIVWGCQVTIRNYGICDENDNCVPNNQDCVNYALSSGLNAGYHLRTCGSIPSSANNANRCLFLLENDHDDETCNAICGQQPGWSCLGRKNECDSNNVNADKCDDNVGDKVCVCQYGP